MAKGAVNPMAKVVERVMAKAMPSQMPNNIPNPKPAIDVTHGNELSGAITLDYLFEQNFQLTCGVVSFIFTNVACPKRQALLKPYGWYHGALWPS